MNAQDDSAEIPAAPHRRRRSFLAVRREESPEAARPDVMSPETAAPETAAPETAAPETAAPETAGPEPDIPAAADEDDIPLLTEVVPSDEPEDEERIADEPKPEPSATFDDRLEELAAQMTEAIERQMAYELPTLIEATLLNAEEGLRTGITATMEAALRDFIVRRQQLQLPLDEPGSE